MLENTRNTAIHKAVKVVYDMSEDTRIREFARMREKALHDYASEMGDAEDKGREEGREEGRKEGREEGRKEGREEMAKKMRELGVSEEIIQQTLART